MKRYKMSNEVHIIVSKVMNSPIEMNDSCIVTNVVDDVVINACCDTVLSLKTNR